MKGVPSASIFAKSIETNKTPYEIYDMLMNGEIIEFDLCKNKKNEISSWLKWSRLFEYESTTQFKWSIKF